MTANITVLIGGVVFVNHSEMRSFFVALQATAEHGRPL